MLENSLPNSPPVLYSPPQFLFTMDWVLKVQNLKYTGVKNAKVTLSLGQRKNKCSTYLRNLLSRSVNKVAIHKENKNSLTFNRP